MSGAGRSRAGLACLGDRGPAGGSGPLERRSGTASPCEARDEVASGRPRVMSGGRDVHDLVAGQGGLGREAERRRPGRRRRCSGAGRARPRTVGDAAARGCARCCPPTGPSDGRIEMAAEVGAARWRRRISCSAKCLEGRVGVLGADRVLLVDRNESGRYGRSGKKKPGHGLAGEVARSAGPQRTRGLERVERRHQVVAEDDVRRVLGRLGDRGGVDDRVVAADDGERVAGVGQVGLDVGDAGRSCASNDRALRDREAVTSWPASERAATVAAPTLPRAPVTRMRMRGGLPDRARRVRPQAPGRRKARPSDHRGRP